MRSVKNSDSRNICHSRIPSCSLVKDFFVENRDQCLYPFSGVSCYDNVLSVWNNVGEINLTIIRSVRRGSLTYNYTFLSYNSFIVSL